MREKDALIDSDLTWMARAIERRGGSVLSTFLDDEGVCALHERCMRYQYEHLFYAEAEQTFAGNPAIENHIRANRYANFPAPERGEEPEDPHVQVFLRALFGQVVRNYRIAVDALGKPGSTIEFSSPLALVKARPEDNLHIPDVRGVFEDLEKQDILAYDEEEKSWFWGPEAEQVKAYRDALDHF